MDKQPKKHSMTKGPTVPAAPLVRWSYLTGCGATFGAMIVSDYLFSPIGIAGFCVFGFSIMSYSKLHEKAKRKDENTSTLTIGD